MDNLLLKKIIFIIIIIYFIYILITYKKIENWRDIYLVRTNYTTYDDILYDDVYTSQIQHSSISRSKLSYIRYILKEIIIIYNNSEIKKPKNAIELSNKIINLLNNKKNNYFKTKFKKIKNGKKQNNLIKFKLILNIEYYKITDEIILNIEYNINKNKLIKLNVDGKENLGFLDGFYRPRTCGAKLSTEKGIKTTDYMSSI